MEYGKLQKAEKRTEQQEVNLTGIPTQMKWDLEARSGLSLDDVRVHYHSDKPAGLGALAYTQGTQVYIGPGQEGHLRHELGHVVQQKLGVVRPNARLPGGPALNTEEALERQADAIGAGQAMLSAGMPPVQRCEDPVVQAAGHIRDISHVAPGEDKVELPDAESPTIVFEAMGVSREECKAVYEQTKKYPGNTVCVFGLNAKPSVTPADFGHAREALKAYADGYDQGDDGYSHLLYTFSFRWTAIAGSTRGYEMPFVEARVLVMQEAAGIVEYLTGGAAAAEMPPQYRFLYRWIDADARDDTTASLSASQLNRFAENPEPEVMAGRYDWRSLNTGNSMKYYKAFLTEFNRAERELRDYYMFLHAPVAFPLRIRTLRCGRGFGEVEQREVKGLSGFLDRFSQYGAVAPLAEIKSNRYLPGYYYPESALMMNQAAHKSIVEAFRWVGDSPDRVLSKIGVPANDAQDKESMRLVSLLGAPRINYEPELSVTKPLKNEFAARTYWGAEMHGFLSGQRRLVDGDEARFNVALRNVRQSAFDPDHWYFISNATWNQWEEPRTPADTDITETRQELFNQKRRELATRLFKYLAKEIIVDEGTNRKKTMRQLIAGEIPPPPAPS